MNNKSYWQKRQSQLLGQLEKDETVLNKKLQKEYVTQAKQLEKEIAGYYAAYGENNVIEYRKLLQSLSPEDKDLLIKKIDDFTIRYPQYSHLLPVRESIYKLNRLEGLQRSILMQQLEIGANNQIEITKHLTKQYNRGAEAMASELGFGHAFYKYNEDVAKKVINKKWVNGENFSERIWKNTEKLTHYLQNDFAAAVARGDNYKKCAKLLTDRLVNTSHKDAKRLIYTEGSFVINEGMITPFEDDFEQYRFSTVGVGACDICQVLDGQLFYTKDRVPGVNFPPMHTWCRCTFLIEIPDNFVERYKKNNIVKSDNSGIIKLEKTNFAKANDLFNYDKVPTETVITPQALVEDLKTSKEGLKALKIIENLPQPPKIDYVSPPTGIRAEEMQGQINIYINDCKDIKTAACSLIHECVHYEYGIGQSQWAESVCVAHELLHRRNRNYLTIDEKRMVIKAVKEAYPEYSWKKGGIIGGRKRSR